LVHTIKGAAGNLSAKNVYLEANILESEIRVNRFDDVELLLEKLGQALDQIFTSISLIKKDVEDIRSSHPGGADITLMKPILNKLEKLLQDNNMDAVECIEEIVRDTKNTAFAEKTAEMKDYVDQYNFEGAVGILNEILHNTREASENEKGK